MQTLCNACGINYGREVKLIGELDLDKLHCHVGSYRLSIHKSVKKLRKEGVDINRFKLSVSRPLHEKGQLSRPDRMRIAEILCTDSVPTPTRVRPYVQNLLCESSNLVSRK